MAAGVYSTRFIEAHGLTTSASYTVPAGHVAIVRDVDAYANVTAAASVFLHGALGQAIWWDSVGIGGQEYMSWRGRQVFLAGETISVAVTVGPLDSVDVTVSGYLLTTP